MNEFCFVIQPFDQGKFDKRYTDVIQPAVERVGLKCYRVDEDPTVSVPITQIEQMIKESHICIADITEDNPNVWFEVGYAMACGKPMVLTCSKERKSKYPFDIQHRRILKYETESLTDFRKYGEMLEEMISGQLKKSMGATGLAGGGVRWLDKDSEGYYKAEIVSNRYIPAKNGKEYRCYQMNGLVGIDEKPVENERHWLFFEAGQFPDLEVGDIVRFKVSDVTEVRNYRGAPNARNVYLEELLKA